MKLNFIRRRAASKPSLPVRGRGLKQNIHQGKTGVAWSLPVRGRGLKLAYMVELMAEISRSPCGGVD